MRRFPLVFDDAAIFPPGNLPLAEAVIAHRAHRDAPYAALVGPLVVALEDLAVLPDLVLARGGEVGPLEVAVVVPDAAGAAAALARSRELPEVRLVALEVASADVASLRAVLGEPAGVTVYVELPRDQTRDDVIAALAATSYRAKLRTGGPRADLYPDEPELAAAVVAVTAAGVRFKATAGLHHALRNTDPETGFEQHGFLNLLAAVRHAGDASVAAEILAERQLRRLPPFEGASLLDSIGTCSIVDPVNELTELGLLDLAAAR